MLLLTCCVIAAAFAKVLSLPCPLPQSHSPPPHAPLGICFQVEYDARSGCVLSCSYDKSVRVWQVGKRCAAPSSVGLSWGGGEGVVFWGFSVRSVSSPPYTYLRVSSPLTYTCIELQVGARGTEHAVLTGHTAPVLEMQVAPGGRTVTGEPLLTHFPPHLLPSSPTSFLTHFPPHPLPSSPTSLFTHFPPHPLPSSSSFLSFKRTMAGVVYRGSEGMAYK